MARTTTGVAIERKRPRPVGRELRDPAGPGENRPGLDSKMQELKAMGDILGKDPKPDLLPLFDLDLCGAPTASFESSGHKQNLPISGMWLFSEEMGIQNRHGQNHNNQQDHDSCQNLTAFHLLSS